MLKKSLFLLLFPLFLALLGATPSPAAQDSKTYLVLKGDCLWKISENILGSGHKWPLLFAENQGQIKNPNIIYPKQELEIPTAVSDEDLKKAYQIAFKALPR